MAPPWSNASDLVLRPEEYRLLRDLFSARIGVYFGAEARFTLERRLRERVACLGFASFAEYHQYLRYHPLAQREWDEVVDLVTTNETYFFREDYQLRSFKDEVLALLAPSARARRRLSIWSAGCSSGEEVYTIAMLVHESRLFAGVDVRIYGCDLSRRCIGIARRAVYGPASFRVTPPEVRARFFVPVKGDARANTPLPIEPVRAFGGRAAGAQPDSGPIASEFFQVNESIRAMCHFGQMNLLDDEKARLLGRADAIFCRNVLIYFDAHTRRRVIATFHERLHPGGVLLLGHSESLLNVSTAFELLHLKEDLVYKKPAGYAREP